MVVMHSVKVVLVTEMINTTPSNRRIQFVPHPPTNKTFKEGKSQYFLKNSFCKLFIECPSKCKLNAFSYFYFLKSAIGC